MSRTPSEARAAGTVPSWAAPVVQGALVQVDDLTWRPFGRRQPVLAGISLRIEAGARVLLAGPSGSGKSTLLRALAGVLTATETGELTGSVLIDGAPATGSSVGLMMQDPADALVAGRAGRDVAFGPENFGLPRGQIWSRVRSSLAAVGFPYDEEHATSALSGGETQRLALAGVLALTPSLVLLDEPTSMLDPASAAVVRGAIISAVRGSGATLVMVEHRLTDWVNEVDRLVVLDPAGRVSADGPVGATLVRYAKTLAAQGVWVPGAAAPRPLEVAGDLCAPSLPRSAEPLSALLVSAESVSRTRQPRVSVISASHPALAVEVLHDVAAEVRAGECVAVVGPSGAGKSTLTALLAGVDVPTKGRVHGRGAIMAGPGATLPDDLHRWTSQALAARFGWVPQQAEQAVVGRTVRDDVLSTSRRLGMDENAAQARADGLLEVLGLSSLVDADPHHLSGGELRRLALAGAIAHGPSVLVLDEPSVGQDRLTWSAVAGVVLAARDAGVAVVLATHDPLLIALADRQITLQAGHLVKAGSAGPRVAEPLAPADPCAPPVRGGTTSTTAHGGSPRPAAQVGPAAQPATGGGFGGIAGRSGPLSLLVASILLVLGAPFITDLQTGLVAVGIEVALAPLVLGLGRPPWRRLLPGLFAVASVSFSNWLLSPGREVSSGALAGLRVAFFVLPGVLLAARIDPSALGDHLGQVLHLPARPVVAAVAALHRFEGLGEHWDQLARIRRIRGLGAGGSPLARGRSAVALTFGLLIETLRQAGRMAVAMEARGFSAAVTPSAVAPSSVASSAVTSAASGPAASAPATSGEAAPALRRTWAEPALWRIGDSLILALGVLVAVIPLLVSR